MHWITLILLSAAVSCVISEPDPKKFKPEENDKKINSTLTDEDKKFLREVEKKFGIKSDIPEPRKEEIPENPEEKLTFKTGFPAVIAIEIVNDTESNGKGKRTIDANLGYGYRTHNGYMYSYFGKPTQEKGKFMIYPYSQHDIPPPRKSHFKSSSHGYYSGSSSHHGNKASIVEIQPSQAYELVPVKGDVSSYDNEKGLETPPPPYPSSISTGPGSTLYTTYNGQQLSSLQGHFPMVMSNYFVEPSQLLQNPHYQSVGLTKDHIQSHDSNTEQRIVPVLVLRVPSSYLKNPSAELYANLPNNYPLSNYLNNVNLQDLVNQYFKKIGFSYAPQIMAYKNEGQEDISQHAEHETHLSPQQYANPYVSPAYTSETQYSGVQLSAVQPVMAKYPANAYSNSQYYVEQPQPQYEPAPQQQYEYQYQYVMPQADPQVSSYYKENNYPQTQYQTSYEAPSEAQTPHVQINTNAHVRTIISQQHEQQVVQEALHNVIPAPAVAIGNHHSQYSGDSSSHVEQSYRESATPTAAPPPTYVSPSNTEYYDSPSINQQYESSAQSHHTPKETVAILSSYARPSPSKHSSQYASAATHAYQTPSEENETKTIVISENYPSVDHTHAYVAPHRYKPSTHGGSKIQQVNYVTPTPFSSSKYQSRYRVMVPQMVLQPDEKVTYVNSHSLPAHYLKAESSSDYNLDEGNTASYQYVQESGAQKMQLYPRNHHPKRMAKDPNHKKESTTKSVKIHSTPKPEKVISSSKKLT